MEEDFSRISNGTSFAILEGATLSLLFTRNFCCVVHFSKQTISTFISFTQSDLLFQCTIFVPHKAKFNVNCLATWQFFFEPQIKANRQFYIFLWACIIKTFFCFLNIMDCLCIQMTYRLSVALDFFCPFRPHFI